MCRYEGDYEKGIEIRKRKTDDIDSVLIAKESDMQRYRKEYSRRRAFHEELRGYGMKS